MFIRIGNHVINLDAISRVDLAAWSAENKHRRCVAVCLITSAGNADSFGTDYQEFFDEDADALREFFGAVKGAEVGYRAETVTLRK